MKRLIENIFRYKNIVFLLSFLIVGLGIFSFIRIPKQDMPEIDAPYVIVTMTTTFDAQKNDRLIVTPLVSNINKLKDVNEIKSYVNDYYIYLIVLFSYDSEDLELRKKTAVSKIEEYSKNADILSLEITSSINQPHVVYSLYNSNLSHEELIAESKLFELALLEEDYIKNVKTHMSYNQIIKIELDINALTSNHLSLSDISNAIKASFSSVPGGIIHEENESIYVFFEQDTESISSLENTVLPGGVLLKDIASLNYTKDSLKEYTYNGKEALFVSVFFEENIDFTKVDNNIQTLKNDFVTTKNITIEEIVFMPDYVSSQLNQVYFSLFLAVIIIFIILAVGLGIRESLLVILVVPVIVFGTLYTLYLSDNQLHKLTIVGIIVAIGMIVDNSIVITEGIKRKVDEGFTKIEAAKESINEYFKPILSSTLTTLFAFFILVLLPGYLGLVVSSMPLTVMIMISISFILSMTLSPLLGAMFIKKTPLNKQNKKIKKDVSSFLIKRPIINLFIILLFVGFSGFLVNKMTVNLYPADERNVLYIDYYDPQETLPSTYEAHNKIKQILENNQSIENYSSSINGDLFYFHYSVKSLQDTSFLGRFFVTIKTTEDMKQVQANLAKELDQLSSVVTDINPIVLSPPNAPIEIEVTSSSLADLNAFKGPFLIQLEQKDILSTYSIEDHTISKKYIIDILGNNVLYGIPDSLIKQKISYVLNGMTINLDSFDAPIQLMVTLPEIETIKSIEIYSEVDQTYHLLGEFISIEEMFGYTRINKLNNDYVFLIRGDFKDSKSIWSIQQEIDSIMEELDDSNIRVNYGGELEMFTEIKNDLIFSIIIILILMFIVLYIQFNNFLDPLIILVTIPLAFSGSIYALFLIGHQITATSLIGLISLIGIVVNIGILLIEYIEKHKEDYSVKKACVKAMQARIRPILLTGGTTILGMIPLALFGGDFFRPFAITFIGGMVVCISLGFILIPSLYFILKKR
ncbi:MAG: efflux RND transporter permease subunit [Candidatus Izimaplasma sp.]|nr:efflux RND transporter permease subunit [Candidatus Izimaplasma bacterium]